MFGNISVKTFLYITGPPRAERVHEPDEHRSLLRPLPRLHRAQGQAGADQTKRQLDRLSKEVLQGNISQSPIGNGILQRQTQAGRKRRHELEDEGPLLPSNTRCLFNHIV